jgi:predicted ATPase
MYRSFAVRDFRCFHELAITDLERVNLIAGLNNVGKTALLEALFLHSGAYNPSLALKLNAFRGIETVKVQFGQWVELPWDSLFRQFDTFRSIELASENTITGRRLLRLSIVREPVELSRIVQFRSSDVSEGVLGSSEGAKVLRLEYEEEERRGSSYMIVEQNGVRAEPIPPPPPFPAFFLGARVRVRFSDEAERFGNLEIHDQQDVLLQVLRLIEPRLNRLAMVVVAGEPMLHGDISVGRLVPLPVMGEGMVRLTSLILHIGNAPKGVVLVDEIENGLHHSILSKVWRAIGEAAREFDTQVFATTHSLECIAAAHKAFAEGELYDFRLHRLERIDGTIRAVTYDQEALEAAIETGLEVR